MPWSAALWRSLPSVMRRASGDVSQILSSCCHTWYVSEERHESATERTGRDARSTVKADMSIQLLV